MLRMANVEPRLKNGLQEAVLLLCKAGLKYESTLSIDGLLAITVDHKEVFVVSIKETVSCSGNCSSDLDDTGKYLSEEPLSDVKMTKNESSERQIHERQLLRIADPCEVPARQRNVNSCNSEGIIAEELAASDNSLLPGKEVSVQPHSVYQSSTKQSKVTLNSLPSRRFQQHRAELSPVNQPSAEPDIPHTKGNGKDSQFAGQGLVTNAEPSSRQTDMFTNKPDHLDHLNLLSKIKTEPSDEFQFPYQVPDPYAAARDVQNEHDIHPGGPVDFSQFSSNSYSVHRLLQSEGTSWPQGPSHPRALIRNMSLATFPRRQCRTSDKSSCVNCGTNTTTVWRRGQEGQLLCNACGCYYKLHKVHRPQSLMRDNIRRRSRRQQGLQWAMGFMSQDTMPFPIAWSQQDT